MEQGPGSNSPREYGPPTVPPPTIPGAVGAPGGLPPRRGGMPWWGWMLAGCGGCAAVCVLAVVIMGAVGVGMFQGMMKDAGPVNQQAIQQSLGEIPLYPGFTVNEPGTQIAMGIIRATEKTSGKGVGSLLKTMAIGTTPDEPEKVFQFYAKKLPPLGWKEAKTNGSSGTREQRAYMKGTDEMFIIQAQPQAGGTMVTIIRGAPGVSKAYSNPPEQ